MIPDVVLWVPDPLLALNSALAGYLASPIIFGIVKSITISNRLIYFLRKRYKEDINLNRFGLLKEILEAVKFRLVCLKFQ